MPYNFERGYAQMRRNVARWPGPSPVILMCRSYHRGFAAWCRSFGVAFNGRAIGGVPVYVVADDAMPSPLDIAEADAPHVRALVGS